MRFLLVGCLATLFLLGCGNNSSQELETNTIEQSSPRITIKNEMIEAQPLPETGATNKPNFCMAIHLYK